MAFLPNRSNFGGFNNLPFEPPMPPQSTQAFNSGFFDLNDPRFDDFEDDELEEFFQLRGLQFVPRNRFQTGTGLALGGVGQSAAGGLGLGGSLSTPQLGGGLGLGSTSRIPQRAGLGLGSPQQQSQLGGLGLRSPQQQSGGAGFVGNRLGQPSGGLGLRPREQIGGGTGFGRRQRPQGGSGILGGR